MIWNGAFGALALTLALLAFASSAWAEARSLTELTAEEVADRCRNDLRALAVYRDGLRSVLVFVHEQPGLFPKAKLKEARMLSRQDRERVLSTWRSLLDYTLALDSLGRHHSEFHKLKYKPQRDYSFLVNYGVFLAQYRFAMDFIEVAENDPGLHTVLNDPVPELGLPEGTYARYKFRFLNVARATEFTALNVIDRFYGHAEAPETRAAIEEDRKEIWKMGRGRGELLTLKNGLRIVQDTTFAAWFPVQAGVAEWMGDTKVWRKSRSLITPAQIEGMVPLLRPGDVLLTRREWYLSNIGLPGFWPHAALFVGTPEERRRFLEDARVKAWVTEQGPEGGDFEALLRDRYPESYALSLKPQEEGHPPRVLEAISEGVSFTTIEHSADADCLAVLRPRLPEEEKALAIFRAFHYSGRPYDFNFDFMTDARLVCSELVYKSYEPVHGTTGLRLPLLDVLGRKTTPPNEIVRQFDLQFDTPEQQFDLILYLDGYEREGRAVAASLAEFRQSWRRPKWQIFIQGRPPEE